MSQMPVKPGRQTRPTTPRWVKMAAIIVVVLVVLFVILHLTGHGFGGHHLPSSLIEHGLQLP